MITTMIFERQREARRERNAAQDAARIALIEATTVPVPEVATQERISSYNVYRKMGGQVLPRLSDELLGLAEEALSPQAE